MLSGPDGAAATLPAGAIAAILATVGPAAAEDAAARLAGRGITVLDAPVSGGVTRAAAGDLLIMVSGPAEAVHRARRCWTRWPGPPRWSARRPATASG